METIWMLAAMYTGKPVVPLEQIRSDFFSNMSLPALIRKTESGELNLPVARMGRSQKSARVVHLVDLAEFLDKRIQLARNEVKQKNS
jgi:pyocin activator protein PrtN